MGGITGGSGGTDFAGAMARLRGQPAATAAPTPSTDVNTTDQAADTVKAGTEEGRASTILTSPFGVADDPTKKKLFLGQ